MAKHSRSRSSVLILACTGTVIFGPLVILAVLSIASSPRDVAVNATAAEASAAQPACPSATSAALIPRHEIAPTTRPLTTALPTDDSSWNPQPPPPVHRAVDIGALSSSMVQSVREAVAGSTYQCSPVIGGAFAQFPFQDVSHDGLLVGLRLGLGKFINSDTIKFVQPIYLTPAGEQLGKGYGMEAAETWDVKAPDGYAVSGATISGGGGLDSISLEFMRIDDSGLDPEHALIKRRIGGEGGGPSYIGGDGTPVIGICGRYNDQNDFMGLGLVFLAPTDAAKPHRR